MAVSVSHSFTDASIHLFIYSLNKHSQALDGRPFAATLTDLNSAWEVGPRKDPWRRGHLKSNWRVEEDGAKFKSREETSGRETNSAEASERTAAAFLQCQQTINEHLGLCPAPSWMVLGTQCD